MGKDTHSHSHSFSKYDTPDERRRKLLKLSSQRDVNRLQKSFNYTRSQTDPEEIERVKRMYYGNEIRSGRKTKTNWGDHYKNNPNTHDLESTIDQIKNSRGKYKHTKHKAKKHDQDQDTFMSVKDLENSGKLNKGSGIPMGMIIGFVMVAVMLVVALPIFSTITDEMQMGSLNGTASNVDSKLAGFPSFVEDNLMIIVFIIPLTLFILMITRFVF